MKLNDFLEIVLQHHQLRHGAINLIASENYTSPLVRSLLASDFGHRYSAEYYGGTKFIRKMMAKTEAYIRELFDADYAILSALSGNLCVLALLFSLTKSGNKVMVVNAGQNGGYPLDYQFFGRKKITFNFSMEDMNLLIEENIEAIKKLKPKLVIFGSSFLPFPHPVKEITEEFASRKTIHFAYDGSHVLGLIAGKQFQDPLREGAQVLLGSTHKTFPGPQGGVIVTNDSERYELLSSALDLDLEHGIRLVDNNHPNRLAALGVAALEMLKFGQEYAAQVVKNSKAFAHALDQAGVPVKFKHLGYSDSHQVFIDVSTSHKAEKIAKRAESVGVMVDAALRLGMAEVTRMGMKELEMTELADIFSQIYFNDLSKELSRRIYDLSILFSEPAYCFKNIDDLPL
ncbi:MAG: hypothetical protein ACTSXO_09800 [Candidatus Heimdallarchaeota archaeon]